MTNTKSVLKQEDCFLGIGNENIGRWPTPFAGILFRDKLSVYEYLCRQNIQKFPEKLFLHSSVYYIRAQLENVFNRFFSSKEIMNIIKDKTWQHKSFNSYE